LSGTTLATYIGLLVSAAAAAVTVIAAISARRAADESLRLLTDVRGLASDSRAAAAQSLQAAAQITAHTQEMVTTSRLTEINKMKAAVSATFDVALRADRDHVPASASDLLNIATGLSAARQASKKAQMFPLPAYDALEAKVVAAIHELKSIDAIATQKQVAAIAQLSWQAFFELDALSDNPA